LLTKIIIYHLEMLHPDDLRPARGSAELVVIAPVQIPCPEFNRFFYTAIGGHWFWLERLPWTLERWRAYVGRPELETWAAHVRGTPAGYFELEMQAGGSVEIVYFGVLPQFIGRGIGGQLLTTAVQRAWEKKATRVWLHTCSLDHPGALANYRSRGFRIFKEVTSFQELPEQSPGPWPGACPPLS
jgi:ribosomal protein S18 acetylase RimI-like enzyme